MTSDQVLVLLVIGMLTYKFVELLSLIYRIRQTIAQVDRAAEALVRARDWQASAFDRSVRLLRMCETEFTSFLLLVVIGAMASLGVAIRIFPNDANRNALVIAAMTMYVSLVIAAANLIIDRVKSMIGQSD